MEDVTLTLRLGFGTVWGTGFTAAHSALASAERFLQAELHL